MRYGRALAALLGAALLLTLAACGPTGGEAGGETASPGAQSQEPQPETRTVLAMDTVMELKAYGDQASEGLARAEEEIVRLEGLFSATREDSEVWAINHAGGIPTLVSQETGELLELSAQLGERTGGALDITVYPVVQAWGFTTGNYRVPEDGELEALLDKVDYTAVVYDRRAGTVTLPEGMELDLGSLGKGYAGTQAAKAMRQAGVTSALLNLGGNVQAIGNKPDGSPWRVAVKDPNQEEGYLGIVELTDQAAVTSGGYERYFEENGQRYWHIMDPATGRPADSGLLSVTVIGADGAQCDGLSTAFFVMGKEAALEYWRTWGGFELVLVEESGTVTVTEGLSSSFTLSDGSAYTLTVAERTP